MKLSLAFPALVPASLVAIGSLMAINLGAEPPLDNPWAAMPKRHKAVSHAHFFEAQDFADIKDDPKAISHRITEKCMDCHPDSAHQVMQTAHWNWKGEKVKVPGHDQPVAIGKANLINNFCISVQANWPSCTKCHTGYGWIDDSFNFDDPKNVDCLVCHEHTGTYAKQSGGGYPAGPVEGGDNVEHQLAFARSVTTPSRDNCGTCHFAGGGGDAIKHGDLNGFQNQPTEEMDIHMGRHDLACVDCHRTESHVVRGRSMGDSVDTTNHVSCTNCHNEAPHQSERLNAHTHAVACQTCHIPTIAKGKATKVWWDWSKAGMDHEDAMKAFGLTDPHDYLSIKGIFRYAKNIAPEYYWYNGEVSRHLKNDVIEDPTAILDINHPHGGVDDPKARIYPFKVHRGKQPYDLKYKHLLIPKADGADGFWGMTKKKNKTEAEKNITHRWHLAFSRGAAITGQKYSGDETGEPGFGFVETQMFWPQAHMVAAADDALQCDACHTDNGESGRMDWVRLGYDGDPAYAGGRLQMNLIPKHDRWGGEEAKP